MTEQLFIGESGPPAENFSMRPEYEHSILLSKFLKQPKGEPPVVGFTDIDNTYIVRTDNPIDRARYQQATADMTKFMEDHHFPIVAVTGRDLPLVTAGQQSEEQLPAFDIVAASVGTELFIRQADGSYVPDKKYERFIEQTIGFNRPAVYAECAVLEKIIQEEAPGLELAFQPRDTSENVKAYQSEPRTAFDKTGQPPPQPHKISYRFHGTIADVKNLDRTFRNHLRSRGFRKTQIVFSEDSKLPDGRTRFNIDVVPVTKDTAINWMVAEYGCRGVVAGDSGNDTQMILRAADAGIVVGGAKAELHTYLQNIPTKRTDRHYRMVDVPGVGDRLIYWEPGDIRGPQSLRRAAHFFSLLKTLRQKA